MSIIKIRTHVFFILMGLALGLIACGGGGDAGPSYVLVIKSAQLSPGPALDRLTTYPPDGFALLRGEGFLPPGSRCAEPTFPGEFDVIRFDEPGPYKLTWTNTTTGESGREVLLWNCETAPTWDAYVPLAPGENHIVVSMSSPPPTISLPTGQQRTGEPIEQTAEIVVTRP